MAQNGFAARHSHFGAHHASSFAFNVFTYFKHSFINPGLSHRSYSLTLELLPVVPSFANRVALLLETIWALHQSNIIQDTRIHHRSYARILILPRNLRTQQTISFCLSISQRFIPFSYIEYLDFKVFFYAVNTNVLPGSLVSIFKSQFFTVIVAAPSSTSCLNIPRDSSYNLPDLPELSLTRCLKRFTQRIPTASTHFAPQDKSLPRLATITSFQEKDICIAMKTTLFNVFFYCSPFSYQMNMNIDSFFTHRLNRTPPYCFPG